MITDSAAILSDCNIYRYNLTRRWSGDPLQVWIMLNPSTADAVQDDPTITRCQKRAQDVGFGAIEVVNLFALRATDPKELRKHHAPIGPQNDFYIRDAAKRAAQVVCAWGCHGKLFGRDTEVLRLLARVGCMPLVLGLTKGNQPRHPLYMPYEETPYVWPAVFVGHR